MSHTSSSATVNASACDVHNRKWRSLIPRLLTSCFTSAAYFDPESRPSEKEHHSTYDDPPMIHSAGLKEYSAAYSLFANTYSEYKLTSVLDSLRASDYARLQRTGEVYVDYTGGALYPETLVRLHSAFLQWNVLGNTHSASNSSQLSASHTEEARKAVLDFFGAPAEEYSIIFTSNATSALKLVGESYPFEKDSALVLGADSHNSIHGIRQFAARAGSDIVYIESTACGGFHKELAKDVLRKHKPRGSIPSLFALTGASNISNSKAPLSILEYASALGYHTLLDAAALAPTSSIILSDLNVDAMAVSFYKMFGYPTGVGALIARKSFLAKLKRPWFAGGTVDIVQVPGTITTMASEVHEQFEDGTINYVNLPAITSGLRFLSGYMPFLPLRLSCLVHYLVTSLAQLRHERTGTPITRILSRRPNKRLRFVGDQSDAGSTISLIFLSPEGTMVPLSLIEYAAARSNISLRTGCMCNPGGAVAMLGYQGYMERLYHGVTLKEFKGVVGTELGVVRISLGLGSNFFDAWRVVKFAEDVIGREEALRNLWNQWETCG